MNKDSNEVKMKFDAIAAQYDQQRRMLIPGFDDFYGIPAAYASARSSTPRILDLGAGTGLFSAYLMDRYPYADLTLADLSSSMLDAARIRFSHLTQVSYIAADYCAYDFDGKFDLIISSLSIHHLEDEAKRAIYAKAYSLLEEGGIFINADQVLGATPAIHRYYEQTWRAGVLAEGLSQANLELALERMKLDKYATVEAQLGWLAEAGFADVDCLYKKYHFAVLTGRKAGASPAIGE
ncbi:class I SAM-dependent methyltransferase [Paenibacillus nasutitermitis]|uniref:SAM-dependent methyltransferase n=1 Tax=Paenibacillus nasutitermitis TaxID=1652958 RepID=A0A916ZFU2_9BACL|nr:class I SAM-dependent methyltransferase [Paenibacillus nasutitermitis]GGD93016.1 SAM-dependent methyltransferase [Paenibacillus nasutitermitis]